MNETTQEEYEAYKDIFMDFMELVHKHSAKITSEKIKKSLAIAKQNGTQIGKKENTVRMQKIQNAWEQGLKVVQISKELGISITCVRYNLDKLGIKYRKEQ